MDAQNHRNIDGLGDDALLKVDEVAVLTRKSRSTLFRDVKRGTFPSPLRTGARSVSWRKRDVLRWIGGIADEGGEEVSAQNATPENASGPTLRDSFAMAALPALLTNAESFFSEQVLGSVVTADYAFLAYEIADAMLEARTTNKRGA